MPKGNTCQFIVHVKHIDISKSIVYYEICPKADILHSHTLNQSDQYKINSYLQEIMQKEAIKGYSPMDVINVLQGTECLAERKQDLETCEGRHLNRHHIANMVKLWQYQNSDERSQVHEDSWEVQVSF